MIHSVHNTNQMFNHLKARVGAVERAGGLERSPVVVGEVEELIYMLVITRVKTVTIHRKALKGI